MTTTEYLERHGWQRDQRRTVYEWPLWRDPRFRLSWYTEADALAIQRERVVESPAR